MESIIYLLLAICDSVYLHLFLWVFHHFIVYIHKRSEFLSQNISKFYKMEGIERQLTAPYTPQQNGVVDKETAP